MAGSSAIQIVSVLKKNGLTLLLLGIALGLAAYLRRPPETFWYMVDWNTIVTLSGLLITTTGIKESGLFYLIACRISRRIDDERILAIFLVFMAAILSMFLTNDIALFITIPLTLHLQQLTEDDYSRIIIFEAIAVNAGSSLTPIGNPQNIFLWHQWGISFPLFVTEMAPVVAVMTLLLGLMTLMAFSSKKIRVARVHGHSVDRGLFLVSTMLLAGFIVSVEYGWGPQCLSLVFITILAIRGRVILECDWGLILLFMLIFIDLHMICMLEPVRHLFTLLDMHDPATLFLSGALFSQVISNVPSAVLLAHHSTDYRMIAWGVDVGGNGLFIASFANLIAIRFSEKTGSWFWFHVWSLPYFMISLASVWCLLNPCPWF
jgi:Na+/H+ antiporter NhaD/arsenite permease-like protein